MDNIIEVRDLVVKFGDFAAVNGISFDVKEGEIFGFLGPNGAGKTTSIRTITTIQRYDSGSVTIDGHDIKTDYLEARKLIGIAQQHISLDKISGDVLGFNYQRILRLLLVGIFHHDRVDLVVIRDP